jgi:hypothetical protein
VSEAVTESWSKRLPDQDGIYRSKMDWLDDDDDAATYHLRNGHFYTPEGAKWICWGGLWKRIGDLPRPAADQK